MLKGDESALISAAILGRSLKEIAEAADVSISTVQRRLQDSDIINAIREGRADQQRQAVGRLNTDLNLAVERLRELMDHDDPRIALSAIDKLMANAHRFGRDLARPEEMA